MKNPHQRTIKTIENHVNILFQAFRSINEIKTNQVKKSFDIKDGGWIYEVDNIIIDLTKERVKQIRNLKPTGKINTIKIYIRVYGEGCGETWSNLEEMNYKDCKRYVFDKLNFNVKVVGFPKDNSDGFNEYISGFHIDMVTNEDTENFDSDSLVHPLHHAQFGFKEDKEDSFGRMMLMNTPRLLHPPLDIILGIDYILSNFAIDLQKKLRSNQQYISLLKKYQKIIWKPYFESIASFWETKNEFINPQNIIPQLYK